MRLASAIPSMMTDRPGAVRIKAAAARAASVAPETAMPTSACLRAGASLTPSPVIPTMWHVLLQYFYDGVLMFWEDLGEAIGCINFLRSIQRDLSFRHIIGEELRRRLDVCA